MARQQSTLASGCATGCDLPEALFCIIAFQIKHLPQRALSGYVPVVSQGFLFAAFQYAPFCHEAKERLQHIDGGGVRGTTLSDRSTQRRTPEETQHPRPRCCCMRSEYRMSILSSLTFYFHTNAHMSASGLRTLPLVWALLVLQSCTLGLSAHTSPSKLL